MDETANISTEECEDNEAIFKLMDDQEREDHIITLWRKALIKGKAGASILRFFNDLSRKITLFGVSRRLEEIELEENPPKYILTPSSKFKDFWNLVSMLLLLYTATYMPYKIAFVDDNGLG